MTKKQTEVQTNVSDLSAAIAAGVAAALDKAGASKFAEQPDEDGGETKEQREAAKLYMKNKKGEMLKCELTLQKKKDAPDPLCVTVNEERYYLPRGVKAIVPWYFVQHMLLNVSREFTQEKTMGPNGVAQYRMKAEDMLTEAFSFREIDPAPDNPPFQQPTMLTEV